MKILYTRNRTGVIIMEAMIKAEKEQQNET